MMIGYGTTESNGVVIPKGKTLYLRLADGANPLYPSQGSSDWTQFYMSGSTKQTKIEGGGNIMSLVSENFSTAK